MKIQTIRQNIGRQMRRWMAIGGVAMMSAAGLTGTASAQETAPGISFRNGQLINGGQAFQVVDPSQVATSSSSVLQADEGSSAGSIFDSGVEQVGLSSTFPSLGLSNNGCNSCGTPTCGGSCGGGSLGSALGGGCGVPCQPYRYVFADFLYMQRFGDSRFSLSQHESLDEFDFETAPRVTLGASFDCVHGYETALTGPLNWSRFQRTTGTGLSSLLIPGVPVAANDLNTFNSVGGSDVTEQRQIHDADYWSIEASRTLIGWQIAKILYGVRYIDYQEDYLLSSFSDVGNGLFQSNVENHLLGGQVGLDLFYPVGVHSVADFRGRAGLYANFVESDYNLANNGTILLNAGDDDVELAGAFEIGSGIRFNLGESLAIRAGSELWYLTGVATAPGQVRQTVRPTDGRRVVSDDDVVIAGLTLSGEFKF